MIHPMLRVEKLKKSFSGLVAVDNISFMLNEASILGIIGPNGSGKSTLFNLISGIHAPDYGQVYLSNKNITRLPSYKIARAGLCRTFQIASPFSKMSVWDNLKAASTVGYWKGHEKRAEKILELTTLLHLREELAENLSGGQQKLLELGRVLMRDPKVVLLDEIGAGVNPALKEQLVKAILGYRREGLSFIVVEHDMNFVRSLCDTIIVMSSGKIIVEGEFSTVLSHPEVISSYLGMEA